MTARRAGVSPTEAFLVLVIFTSIAGGACYLRAPSTNCCAKVATFDGIGNCSPWAHTCPDIAIANPPIQQVVEAAQNQGGQIGVSSVQMTCQYQPRGCNIFGCSDSGPIATAGCFDEVPQGAFCPSGPPV